MIEKNKIQKPEKVIMISKPIDTIVITSDIFDRVPSDR